MSAANYKTMENFPLLAGGFVVHEKECLSCGAIQMDGDNDICECCGGELREVSYIDNDSMQDTITSIQKRLQLYVEECHNPNEYDNIDCRCYFDMYRSVAIRRYNSEVNKLCRVLRRLGAEFGFVELSCVDVFANGEAFYE